MKDELCQAFCGELTIREVPAGLAVSTAFDGAGGDPIGFYIVGPDPQGRYHIEDDGVSVTYIEAYGADLKNKTRLEAFNNLLEEYSVEYDEETGELVTSPLDKKQIPHAALSFVALLLRVQDIILMAAERAASTFHEDAMREIKEVISDRASIHENEPIDPKLAEFDPDVVLRAKGYDPVAVFFGASDLKVTEAIIMQMAAKYEAKVQCSVVALLEKEKSVSKKTLQRAANRLAAIPIFRGDEKQAVARIAQELFERRPRLH